MAIPNWGQNWTKCICNIAMQRMYLHMQEKTNWVDFSLGSSEIICDPKIRSSVENDEMWKMVYMEVWE